MEGMRWTKTTRNLSRVKLVNDNFAHDIPEEDHEVKINGDDICPGGEVNHADRGETTRADRIL